MVVASDREVKVGTVHRTGAVLKDPTHTTKQPLVILRKATRDEWIQSCIELDGSCVYPDNPFFTHFYEVSTD